MEGPQDTVVLRNGYEIPCLGFGTWKMPGGQIGIEAVQNALEAGYRHIDTAAAYGNEATIGQALPSAGLPREDIFITSKLWTSERGFEPALAACRRSLDALGLDYLDLYLVHWPCARGSEKEWQAVNAETWRAFEKLYREGLVRAIGVSNFKPHHLAPLIEGAEIHPMVDQIEMHPGFPQRATRMFCDLHGILVEAWSPLGHGEVLDDPLLASIALKYSCTLAQLCIRWCLQHGALPLPKSVTPARIRENLDVFGFGIEPGDMDAIDALKGIGLSGLDPDTVDF